MQIDFSSVHSQGFPGLSSETEADASCEYVSLPCFFMRWSLNFKTQNSDDKLCPKLHMNTRF